MTENTYFWIISITDIIVAIAIIFAWIQLSINRKQIAVDHERSRRELSIKLLANFSRNHSPEASAAKKLVEGFNREQITLLWGQNSFNVSITQKNLVYGALIDSEKLKEDSDFIRFTEDESSELRWQIITFLNNLEVILSAWHHNVADRDLIEEQFKNLVSPSEGQYILKTFREVVGIESYPSLNSFVEYLNTELSSQQLIGKEKIA